MTAVEGVNDAIHVDESCSQLFHVGVSLFLSFLNDFADHDPPVPKHHEQNDPQEDDRQIG
jgi:hypothetical protein